MYQSALSILPPFSSLSLSPLSPFKSTCSQLFKKCQITTTTLSSASWTSRGCRGSLKRSAKVCHQDTIVPVLVTIVLLYFCISDLRKIKRFYRQSGTGRGFSFHFVKLDTVLTKSERFRERGRKYPKNSRSQRSGMAVDIWKYRYSTYVSDFTRPKLTVGS